MARQFADAFYRGKKWQKCRASYISKRKAVDGGYCERCHTNLGYIVHHRIELTPENINIPDISLNHANLKYVCKDCHELEPHSYRRKEILDQIKYGFDSEGNIVPL